MKFIVSKGFVEIESKDPYMRSFLVAGELGNVRVNVWSNTKDNTFTVGTAMLHPKKKRTQLFRRHCTKKEVLEILKNPRIHTGKGYYKRS